MKCKKCGNEYPSQYYFATKDICESCFEKLTDNERELEIKNMSFNDNEAIISRVGFGRRFGAILIDGMIVSIISIVVIYFSGFFKDFQNFLTIVGDIPPTNTAEIMKEYMTFINDNKSHFILMLALNLVYFSLEVFAGASLGKMILGLQIMTKDKEPANNMNLLIRFLLKNSNTVLNILFFYTMLFPIAFLNNIISIVIFFGLFMVFSSKRQTLYDLISSTAVYRKED